MPSVKKKQKQKQKTLKEFEKVQQCKPPPAEGARMRVHDARCPAE